MRVDYPGFGRSGEHLVDLGHPSTVLERLGADTLEDRDGTAESGTSQGVDGALERVLARVDTTHAAQPITPDVRANGLGAAWVVEWTGKRRVSLRLSGSGEVVEAELLRELELELVQDAVRDRQLVLVERQPEGLTVIGVIATRKPKKLVIDAETIELLATRSLLLRVGRAALELRHDGNVELVGSRISAASRGLFRLVGRMLRLN